MGHIADLKEVMLPWGMLVYVRPVFACESNVMENPGDQVSEDGQCVLRGGGGGGGGGVVVNRTVLTGGVQAL